MEEGSKERYNNRLLEKKQSETARVSTAEDKDTVEKTAAGSEVVGECQGLLELLLYHHEELLYYLLDHYYPVDREKNREDDNHHLRIRGGRQGRDMEHSSDK